MNHDIVSLDVHALGSTKPASGPNFTRLHIRLEFDLRFHASLKVDWTGGSTRSGVFRFRRKTPRGAPTREKMIQNPNVPIAESEQYMQYCRYSLVEITQ